ncbi:hypothetical protein HF086_002703 [Spodoptera exigua]|uniref:Amyloid protein-binding protein 2 n=1 Tax=Spodoptera exigua TaxID=7107 RepID=A0A922SCS6_SPOEX|nr:hypothetical protein HF086_002703 [Spodoptera exigua]
MLQEKRLCILGAELSELDTFERLMRFAGSQLRLLQCFQVSGFLNEAGWYADAQRVLLRCRDLCREMPQTTHYKRLTLECCHRLLNTQSAYCCFPAAAETYALALDLLGMPDDVTAEMPEPFAAAEDEHIDPNDPEHKCDSVWWVRGCCGRCGAGAWGATSLLARVCKEFSALAFVRCDYSAAYDWAMRALKLLTPHTPPKYVAHIVLEFNIKVAHIQFQEALSTLRRVFGRSSLHVATAQEDLAYALYVLEYSSGRFYKARDHAERAIRIIENLVPPDHLLLACLCPAPSLLEESEALHKAALELSMMAFGEKNVQTAKHYGNLGRLYQSMHKFQDAETMHLKAIAIKEELLGPEDYEVGLSIGHLASLYNYHMNMHCAAEKLYLRSISISLKLFGERYSGLEYDYRGLVHVFTQLKRHDRANHYNRLLQHWQGIIPYYFI